MNKKQKVTSLLDEASLAMMYNEPTNDGYNKIKHHHDEYKEVYDRLTPQERELSLLHPYLALSIKKKYAKSISSYNAF